MRGFVTKYFKERHALAQLYLDMVECVLRRYRKKKGRPDRSLQTAIESPRVALNGLFNDKLDFNETQLGNHAKELTEFGFLA